MRIFKYTLQVTGRQTVNLPVGARILSVQFQHGYLTMWAAVNPDEKVTSARGIRIFGTGHEIDISEDRISTTYITTVQQGPLVWHIFEEK